jgi:nitroreductase
MAMAELDVFEAMRTMRTVRRLRPAPVPDEVLRRVLTAATWAPSGGNRQPWRFVVVREAALKRQLQEMYLALWQTFSAAYTARLLETVPPEERASSERMLRAADHLAQHLHEVPVIVVVCVHVPDLAITDGGFERPPVVGGASIYPAVQNLLLACRAVGLGAALTTLLCQKEPEVQAMLSIPKRWATCAHIAIGHPEGTGHGAVKRRPVDEVAYLDRWEQPLFPR